VYILKLKRNEKFIVFSYLSAGDVNEAIGILQNLHEAKMQEAQMPQIIYIQCTNK
jgi:hypothetical protein